MSEGRTLPAWLATLRSGVDRGATPARYARRAPPYGAATASSRDVRGGAGDLHTLLPGETVFAVACDIEVVLCGLSWRVGPHVRVVFVKQNPEMAAQAVESLGSSDNVCVLFESAKIVRVAVLAPAVICCCLHDVPQSSRAVANLFARARPFTRMSVADLRLLPAWATAVNAWMLRRAIHSHAPGGYLRSPQGPLVDGCSDLNLAERCRSGTGRAAAGTVRLH